MDCHCAVRLEKSSGSAGFLAFAKSAALFSRWLHLEAILLEPLPYMEQQLRGGLFCGSLFFLLWVFLKSFFFAATPCIPWATASDFGPPQLFSRSYLDGFIVIIQARTGSVY